MSGKIDIIESDLILASIKFGTIKCYLVQNGTEYVLIDTGPSDNRVEIEKELERAGCTPENLKLIIITHGDMDHTGNAAYLREKFATKIAIHPEDSGMVEYGDMFCSREANFLIKSIVSMILKLDESDRFKPDLYMSDGDDLSEYGFNAKVIHIPGHSEGSIGILTANNDLFCGDLIINKTKPDLNLIVFDKTAANTSVERLKKLNINNVYPAHGKPFSGKFLTELE